MNSFHFWLYTFATDSTCLGTTINNNQNNNNNNNNNNKNNYNNNNNNDNNDKNNKNNDRNNDNNNNKDNYDNNNYNCMITTTQTFWSKVTRGSVDYRVILGPPNGVRYRCIYWASFFMFLIGFVVVVVVLFLLLLQEKENP